MEEIELTYLPKELPKNLKDAKSKEMLDIYIPSSVEHPTLRIRKSGNVYEITKKQPIKEGDSSHQLETTVSLSAAEYAEISGLTGKRVQKTRFYYDENGINYEIDVFRGDLSGLVLVDIEFKSLKEKSAFRPPTWLLADVTQEKFSAGGMLCGKRYTDIEDKLEKFYYKKIKI